MHDNLKKLIHLIFEIICVIVYIVDHKKSKFSKICEIAQIGASGYPLLIHTYSHMYMYIHS